MSAAEGSFSACVCLVGCPVEDEDEGEEHRYASESAAPRLLLLVEEIETARESEAELLDEEEALTLGLFDDEPISGLGSFATLSSALGFKVTLLLLYDLAALQSAQYTNILHAASVTTFANVQD